MRILMWFAIGFAAACALCVYLLEPTVLLIATAVSLVVSVGLLLWKPRVCKIIGVAVLGCAIGFGWMWGFFSLRLAPAMELDRKTLQSEVFVTDYSAQTEHGIAADGYIVQDERKLKVRLYLTDVDALEPGDKILGEFDFYYDAYGSGKSTTNYQADGIYLQASANEYELVRSDKEHAGSFPIEVRHQILLMLDKLFPEDTAGFARALLLGDTSKLSYQMDTAFSVSGIRHVVAVSGLHVSIVLSLVYLLCGRQRILSLAIGLPILVLFVAVAGFSPSVVRACIMQLLILGAEMFLKEYDAPTTLSFAGLCILLANPLNIASVGFQLSFACVAGILAFSPAIYQYLTKRKWMIDVTAKGIRAKLCRGILTSISISVAVWVTTTPLCALYFGMVSLVGFATNLLTLWLISYIFCMIIGACALGAIWFPLGVGVAWLTAWLVRLIQQLSLAISRIPFAAVYTDSIYIVLWLLACYVLIGLFVLLKFHRPKLLLGCMSVCLAIAVGITCLEEWQKPMKVTVLDVGQGQCIILKNQDKYYMVDCGSDSAAEAADAASAYLLSKGVYYLDGLILTHYDYDHAAGAAILMSRIPALRLYLPDMDADSAVRAELKQTYSDRIQWVNGTWQIPWADITMIRTEQGNADNESGICVLFQPENYDILITGDRSTTGEQALMDAFSLPRLDLLVAGHHGSNGATGMELLGKTMPAAVVISVGEENSFGHPGEELLQRLEMFGCQVHRTDRDGTIEYKG